MRGRKLVKRQGKNETTSYWIMEMYIMEYRIAWNTAGCLLNGVAGWHTHDTPTEEKEK